MVHPFPFFSFTFWFVVLCFILYVKVIRNKRAFNQVMSLDLFVIGGTVIVINRFLTVMQKFHVYSDVSFKSL